MPPPRPRGFAGSSGGSNTRPAPNTPMSERQQMALLMQMTSSAASPSSTSSSEMSPGTMHNLARSRDRNERGETSLHVAAIKGDQDTVKKLLESGVSPNVADFAGWTPLHEACNHAHYNVALTLVKAGANVNARGLDDDTPLHDAATIGHLKLVKMLVEKGADINLKNRKGRTPVDIAHPTVASYLQAVRDSPANRAVQQQMRRAEQKKIIEEHDDHITHTSGTSHSGSGSGNKEEDDIYEFKSTPKDSSSGSGSEDNKPDNRKIDKRSISEEKNSDDPLSGIGSNNSGNISVSSISSKVNTNLTGSSSSGGSGNLNISSGNSGNNSGGGGGGGGGGGSSSSSSGGATKRVYSDIEGHDDTSTDGDELKKRRRNYCGDNTNKQGAGGRNTQSQRQEKGVKQSGGSNKSLGGLTGKNSTNLERKSPCPSPKSTSANKNTDSDTETDDNKNSDSFGNNGGPKVPPLKIVIPQQNPSGDNEVGPRNGKNNSTRNHQALPYVVASSSNSNDSVAADRESTSSRCGSPADSNGKNSSSSLAAGDEKSNMKGTSEERAQQRVLRSSHRGGQGVDRGSNNSSPQLQSSSPSPAGPNEKEDNSIEDKKVIGSSSTGGGTASGNGNSNKNNTNTNNPSPANNSSAQNSQTETESNAGNVPSPSASSTSSTSKEVPQGNVELHPRKRKIRANKQDDSSNKSSSAQSKDSQANSNESTSTVNEVHPHDHPFTNCYQMYLNIRKQIEKKHKSLMPIQPRPPQGFKDYLLNRKTYALAGKIPTEPVITIPKNLPNQMKELFTTQEKERYKLKTQHTIEREKLGLTVEQEILRVHAKAARSLACQSLPLSVCTIIKDQEVYNMITPEQEEKDRNARSRYNGRLFLSWLQDVDDKWEKIKESMLLRHHNEAESLHAVQKMDWEWLMKEHSLCDYKSQPVIDESHVPMVHVSDDFDLLPA